MSDDTAERRKSVRFDRTEVLLILRSYQAHPGLFSEILQTIRENSNLLSKSVKSLYETEDNKRLIQRIREKLQRLLSKPDEIQDSEIRREVDTVVSLKKTLVTSTQDKPGPTADQLPSCSYRAPVSSGSEDEEENKIKKKGSKRKMNESSDSEGDVRSKWAQRLETCGTKNKKGKRKSKKRSLREIIKKNEKMKNKLLKRLLTKTANISTSSSSSDDI